MKQRPILFNTEMVQAILAGRKTQTRRVVKFRDHQPTAELHFIPSAYPHFQFQSGNRYWQAECPYGRKGDVLWVRETLEQNVLGGAIYRAGGKVGEKLGCNPLTENEFLSWDDFSTTRKVIPSIHMPKDAARIWLRIKDVRVERLQDISDEDIRAEGAAEFGCTTHRLNWQTLWESVNGSNSWKDNPFVWVIEFERIEKP
jgi:hypothetical protein